MTLISLEFNYTRTDCEKGKIEIDCIVDSKLLSKIDSITLKRFEKKRCIGVGRFRRCYERRCTCI